MLVLWGRSSSINVQKVLWTLDELRQPFEHIPAGGDYGGLDDPEFRKRNPHGLVPVLSTGTASIWETNSIIRFLAAEHGSGGFCPAPPEARALCDMWMDWALSTLQPAIVGLFWGYYRTPEVQRDKAKNETLLHQCHEGLAKLDAVLASRPYLAGDAFTMADIPSGALLYRYFGMGLPHPEMPALQGWYERLQDREAYQRRIMQPFDELFGRLAF